MLSDYEILKLCQTKKMIEPYSSQQVSYTKEGRILSYGLSSFGYDVRCSNLFSIFKKQNPQKHQVIDPKDFDTEMCDQIRSSNRPVTIPPNSFALTMSHEYITVPEDVMVICVGKSTYARCGVITNVTPLEPGWRGHITIEISNTAALPARIYPFEGIIQLVFFRNKDVPPMQTYGSKMGKYQDQFGITYPKV